MIDLWERAAPARPIDRATAILTAAWPELSDDAVADLPIGARDRLLLTARAACFGPLLEAKAACPACGGAIELSFDIRGALAAPVPPATLSVALDGAAVDCRLPAGRDLAALAAAGLEGRAAERFLVERCAGHAGSRPLSDQEIDDLGDSIAHADPWSELILSAECPECGGAAELLLDPLGVLWAEIEAKVRGLMFAVARLAHAFGWREVDILGMSEVRRRAYLAMVPA